MAFLLCISVVDIVNNYILANLRVFHNSLNVAVPGSRDAVKKTLPLNVGLWENLSLAMLRSRGLSPALR